MPGYDALDAGRRLPERGRRRAPRAVLRDGGAGRLDADAGDVEQAHHLGQPPARRAARSIRRQRVRLGTNWGVAQTDDGDNIVWGTRRRQCDNIVWGTARDDNIVWGTVLDMAGDNIVWGTAADGDNIVWGTDCGGADCDNIVWGTADGGDNIVWGTRRQATTSSGARRTAATTSCGARADERRQHRVGHRRCMATTSSGAPRRWRQHRLGRRPPTRDDRVGDEHLTAALAAAARTSSLTDAQVFTIRSGHAAAGSPPPVQRCDASPDRCSWFSEGLLSWRRCRTALELDTAASRAGPADTGRQQRLAAGAAASSRGEQVVLRELRASDAASLFALLTTEEVSRFISPPPTSVEGFERFIAWTLRQRSAGTYACFAVTLKGFDTAIGIFQVRQLEPGFGTAEWGFAIGSAFWGTGRVPGRAPSWCSTSRSRRSACTGSKRARRSLNGRGNGALLKIGAVQEAVLPASRSSANGELSRPGRSTRSSPTTGGAPRSGRVRRACRVHRRARDSAERLVPPWSSV